jgi:hypothetical protein
MTNENDMALFTTGSGSAGLITSGGAGAGMNAAVAIHSKAWPSVRVTLTVTTQ